MDHQSFECILFIITLPYLKGLIKICHLGDIAINIYVNRKIIINYKLMSNTVI